MISVELARQKILSGVKPLGAELVALERALGRVLAEDVVARVDHPPLDVSAMDGYAVRAADIALPPNLLAVIGQSAAGRPFGGSVGPGQAVRIFTGAAVPPGADTVVMQEDAVAADGAVSIRIAQDPGRFIRRQGQDFTLGQTLLKTGQHLSARAIGLAAAMNHASLFVRRRPHVAVLSTGDEIALPGEMLGPGQIPGSNGLSLCALIRAAGGHAVHLGIARDNRDSLLSMIRSVQGVDLLLTTGGASAGDYDLVQDALLEAGMHLDFYKIAMRPGKPLMSGQIKGVPVLGLSGNPVAAMVSAYVFVLPLLRALQGLEPVEAPVQAVLGGELPANDVRQDYLRGKLDRQPDGRLVATALDRQDSAVISALTRADCLMIRPPHAPQAHPGEPIDIIVLPASH